MAKLIQPLSDQEINKLGLTNVKMAYKKLSASYSRILDGNDYQCHFCNSFYTAEHFYADERFATGLYPECKIALLHQACDYDKKTKQFKDNREKTIAVFRKLDLPFIEDIYNSALTGIATDGATQKFGTAYQSLLTVVKTLSQYSKLGFADSEFIAEEENAVETKRKARKEIKKTFGNGYSESDYLYLQDQYDDFKARTQVDSKSQEVYVTQICMSLLDIDKDRKAGKDVTNKLKALDTLMNAANLQPKQNVGNAATDSLTFGQLIEKWELEKPIPEPSEEFKDVDGIGKYLRVWFAGHLAHALGLKNAYSEEYEEYVKKYKVTKPEVQEEGRSEDVYNHLFGKDGE